MGTDTPRVDAATLGDALRAQSDPTRRQLLAYLDERGDGVAFSDLVNDLAEPDDPGISTPLPDEESVAVRLHHVHLPKLEAAGLVEVTEGPTGRKIRLSDDVQRVRARSMFLHVDE